MAEKKFGVREINVIDLTGTPTIESTGTLNINAGSGSDVNINTDLNVTGVVSDSAGSLRNLPQVSKSSAYTLIASDTGKHVSISSGGVTVASGVFSIGDVVIKRERGYPMGGSFSEVGAMVDLNTSTLDTRFDQLRTAACHLCSSLIRSLSDRRGGFAFTVCRYNRNQRHTYSKW